MDETLNKSEGAKWSSTRCMSELLILFQGPSSGTPGLKWQTVALCLCVLQQMLPSECISSETFTDIATVRLL